MDLEERVKISILIKYYGKLLTDKQQNVLFMYVDNNLSLAEVSEELRISRQAVKDSLDKSLETLSNLEQKLGFIKRDEKLKNIITNSKLDESDRQKILSMLEEI